MKWVGTATPPSSQGGELGGRDSHSPKFPEGEFGKVMSPACRVSHYFLCGKCPMESDGLRHLKEWLP